MPDPHHITEESAQIQIISIDGARRTQFDDVQIVQILNHGIREIQIRCVAIRVRHIDIAAHKMIPPLNFAKLIFSEI